ncbi:hypothetical protein [Deinococcus koreensis]|nr:hypothetical protein [Deinococcus koreensis]
MHDVQHEAALGAQVHAPAAVVVNCLRNRGLLDALRNSAATQAGKRSRAA